MDNRRRIILFAAPALALGLAGSRTASAQAKVTENDPTAMALGYKEDASKVDTAKYKQYVKGSMCSNCNFYAGNGPTGTCAALGNRLVVGKGWCSAYTKRP